MRNNGRKFLAMLVWFGSKLNFAISCTQHKQKGYRVPVPHLRSPAFAFTIVDSINKSSVIPVLDHIVWAIMDLDLNCVSSIVDEEDDALLPTSQHC